MGSKIWLTLYNFLFTLFMQPIIQNWIDILLDSMFINGLGRNQSPYYYSIWTQKLNYFIAFKILVIKIFTKNMDFTVAATINYEIPSLAHIKKEHYLETIEECDEIDHSCDMDIGPVEIRNDQLDQINENNLSSKEIVEHNSDIHEGQIFQHFLAPSYQVEVEYETEVEATEW